MQSFGVGTRYVQSVRRFRASEPVYMGRRSCKIAGRKVRFRFMIFSFLFVDYIRCCMISIGDCFYPMYIVIFFTGCSKSEEDEKEQQNRERNCCCVSSHAFSYDNFSAVV